MLSGTKMISHVAIGRLLLLLALKCMASDVNSGKLECVRLVEIYSQASNGAYSRFDYPDCAAILSSSLIS